MNSSTSPLLKMSFETTMQFMQDACLYVASFTFFGYNFNFFATMR